MLGTPGSCKDVQFAVYPPAVSAVLLTPTRLSERLLETSQAFLPGYDIRYLDVDAYG